MRSVFTLALCLTACAPSLPEADEAADRGIRAVWATLQDAVRTGDAEALAALEDPEADAGVAEAVMEAAASWPQVREAILETRAFDLTRYVDGRYAFVYTPPDGPQPDGFEITFREDADGRVYLTTATYIG